MVRTGADREQRGCQRKHEPRLGKNERDLRKLQHKRCSGSSCGEEEVKQNREGSGRRRWHFYVQLIAAPKRVLIGNLL